MSDLENVVTLKRSLNQLILRLKGLSAGHTGEDSKLSKLDSDSILALKEAAYNASKIIDAIDELAGQDYVPLSLNIKFAEKMLDDLTYSLNSRAVYRDGKILRLSEEAGAILIPQLISGLVACLNNAKIDCFFFRGGFLGKAPSEYNKLIDIIEAVENFKDEIADKKMEADTLLKRMELTEKAVLRVGLAAAFKQRVSRLFWRILGLDLFNYIILLSVFVLTIGIIIDLESISFLYFLKLKNIGMYERFLVIVPLLFISWFVSKRSQFLYQIKEEYSYKQTFALAYEAYKNEAEKDEYMLNKLLEATIDNLGRSPLEQFDKNSDHTPYTQLIREFRKKSE